MKYVHRIWCWQPSESPFQSLLQHFAPWVQVVERTYCFSSHSTWPTRAPLQGTPRWEPPPKGRAGIFDVVVQYWNKFPASVVTAPFVNVFKKRFEKVLTEVIDWTLISPFTYPPPIPPANHPLALINCICYPTPCSIYLVSSSPLWPTFNHYKS